MSLRVIELCVENFKRLRAVRIVPKGRVTQITGANAQGKTSVLEALEVALRGKGTMPERPVRDGEDSSLIIADLGDLLVRKRIKPNGDATTEVVAPDGSKLTSPQAILDKLYSAVGFDALAFSRMAVSSSGVR